MVCLNLPPSPRGLELSRRSKPNFPEEVPGLPTAAVMAKLRAAFGSQPELQPEGSDGPSADEADEADEDGEGSSSEGSDDKDGEDSSSDGPSSAAAAPPRKRARAAP